MSLEHGTSLLLCFLLQIFFFWSVPNFENWEFYPFCVISFFPGLFSFFIIYSFLRSAMYVCLLCQETWKENQRHPNVKDFALGADEGKEKEKKGFGWAWQKSSFFFFFFPTVCSYFFSLPVCKICLLPAIIVRHVSGHIQPWYYSASLYSYRRSIVNAVLHQKKIHDDSG